LITRPRIRVKRAGLCQFTYRGEKIIITADYIDIFLEIKIR